VTGWELVYLVGGFVLGGALGCLAMALLVAGARAEVER